MRFWVNLSNEKNHLNAGNKLNLIEIAILFWESAYEDEGDWIKKYLRSNQESIIFVSDR
jgi:hypothetical protein